MEEGDVIPGEYFLKPGYIFLTRWPTLISSVLGSCVAISLWDRKNRYGGMAHYLYPRINDRERGNSQYGNVAIPFLLKMFTDEGSCQEDVQAQIFGGASLSDAWDCQKVADENIETARTILNRMNIKIVSEDVGGDMGRKLIYNTQTNEAVIYKSGKIRRSDWYPYVARD